MQPVAFCSIRFQTLLRKRKNDLLKSNWLAATRQTDAELTGLPGHGYYFRLKAADNPPFSCRQNRLQVEMYLAGNVNK